MGLFKSNSPDLRIAISYCALKYIGPRYMDFDHLKKISNVLIAILRAPCGQREYAIFSKDSWTTEKLSVKILNETEFFKAFSCDLQGEFDSNEVKKFWFSYLEQKELIFDPNRVDHISRETAWAKLGAKRKAVQDALDYAKEKAIKDKAAEDKAAAKEKQEAANNSRIEAANNSRIEAAKNSRKEAANNSRNVKKKTIQSAKELEAVEAENGKPGNKKKNHIENSTIVLLGASMKEMLKKSTEELSKTLKQNISVLESSTKAQINKVL
jgi:hypothetical protein